MLCLVDIGSVTPTFTKKLADLVENSHAAGNSFEAANPHAERSGNQGVSGTH